MGTTACYETSVNKYHIRSVKFQKNEGHVHTGAKAWNTAYGMYRTLMNLYSVKQDVWILSAT